jgi:riboflavin kinase/FMN adenylyltransferase
MAISALREFRPTQPTALTLGTFDGVHRGHRALLERTHTWAQEHRALSVAFVFTRPPTNYMGAPKPLLMPVAKKLDRISQIVEHVLAVEFSEVGAMAAEEFVEKILVGQLRMAHIVIGPDARFGRGRGGDRALLERLGRTLGFSVEVVPSITVNGKIVSSTAIRESLLAGRLDEAREMLGYAPTLWGTVVHGDGRGRKLGYPTANLALEKDVLVPAAGVYAVRVRVKGAQRDGVLYIGSRATFGGSGPSIEVHLFDTEEDLYGMELEVELLKYLRGDARFERLEDLKAQIEADIQAARAALGI